MKKEENKKVEFVTHELKKQKEVDEDYKRIVLFIILVIIIGALLFGLYYLNGKYITKDKFQNTTTTTTEAIYDDSKLTVSNLFSLSDSTYYVLVYDRSDSDSIYYSLELSYSGDTNLYTIDVSNAMNKMYYDEDGTENTNPTSVEDVMFTRPTLLEIKKGKVSKYITSEEEIVEILS